ncbi:MAG TPA: cytochrome c [Kofleriaceae bacterium]|nr:cytochrome c [Kofleriaceae bacterium]
MRNTHFLALILVLAVGCSKKAASPDEAEPSSAPSSGQPVAAAQNPTDEAQTTFKTVCATCHGESGLGNGPGAATLTPKPRNYTDRTWQASVSDDQIKQTILMGGAAVGKSPAMPAQPQLKEKPEVVAALVQIIRTFGK